MSLNTAIMEEQHDLMLAQLPITVTYDGVDYANCTRTQKSLDHLYMDAGRMERYQFSILCSTELKNANPEIDSRIVIGDTTYRILGDNSDSGNIQLRLDIGSEYATE